MTQDLGALRARLLLESQQFKAGMQDARNQMKQTGWSAQQLGNDFGIVQRASLAVGVAIAAGLGASVTVAAQFEQSMAKVKAISGATAEDFAALEKAARDAGATTVFSASQAADALSYLAMAGFKVNDQVSALPAVLNAAAAGQIDLARSADIVSNIMTGFGIKAEDTGKAVDILVKTMTTANTDLPMLGDAMKYVAPVAASLGLGIEETAAAIAKMSDSGIQGAQAGTSLRAALLSLANPTGQTEEAMKNLGIKVTDANGKMKPLPELMGHIAESMEGLTDAQKTQAAAQLVGTEAASGFLAILKVGEKGLKDFTNQLKNSGGTAERIAKVQNDTLIGSFKEFQSALEEAGIKLGKEFLPLFTELVREGTKVVRFLTELDSSTIKSGLAFAGTAAAVALTATSIGKLVIAARGLMLTMGPAGWLITGISLLAGAVMGAKTHWEEMDKVQQENIRTLKDSYLEVDSLIKQFEGLQTKSKLTTDEFIRWVDIQDRLKQTVDPQVIADLTKEADELQKKSGLSNDELETMLGLNDRIIQEFPGATKVISEQGKAIVTNLDKIKQLNQQKFEELQLKTNERLLDLRTKYYDNLLKEKSLTEELKVLEEERSKEYEYQEELGQKYFELKKQYYEAIEKADYEAMGRIEEEMRLVDEDYRMQKQNTAELNKQVAEKQKTLDKTKQEILEVEKLHWELINNELAYAGINGTKEDGIRLLEDEILKLQEQKRKLESNTSEAAKNTEEYQESVKKIDDQLLKLQAAKSKVIEIRTEAQKMNYELGKSVYKSVTVNERTVRSSGTGRDTRALPTYHTGGRVGGLPAPFSARSVGANSIGDDSEGSQAKARNAIRMLQSLGKEGYVA